MFTKKLDFFVCGYLTPADEEPAKVVKRIFELYKNHESARHIADILNKEGVLNPQTYYYQSMGKENPYNRNTKSWCSATILSILKKEVYIGHMVQGRKMVKSYKTKKLENLPREKWAIAENKHEPIIEADDFKAIQLMFNNNRNSKPRRTAVKDDVSLFSNLLRCKDCGSILTFNTMQRKTKVDCFYRCSRYIQHGSGACNPHRISLDVLSGVVLEDIKNNARLANEDKETFIKALHEISLEEKDAEIKTSKKKVLSAENRLKEIDWLIKKTFEKNIIGGLSDSMFISLSQGYEKEKADIEEALSALRIVLEQTESMTVNISKEVDNLKQYAEIAELTRNAVTSLIQTIYISEPKKVGKEKAYDIEIRYKFQSPYKKEDTLSANKVSSVDVATADPNVQLV